MPSMNEIQQFLMDTGTSGGVDVSATNDDGDITFYACTKVQVVEIGCHVTTDVEAGAADVAVLLFDKTTASVGDSGSETSVPARALEETLNGVLTDVDVQDGKVISKKVDFTLEKGDTLIAESGDAPVAGRVIPYILYRTAGQAAVEPAEQRSSTAAE